MRVAMYDRSLTRHARMARTLTMADKNRFRGENGQRRRRAARDDEDEDDVDDDEDERGSTRGSRQHGDQSRRGSRDLDRVLNELATGMQELRETKDGTEREKVLQRQNFQYRRRNARLLDELREFDEVFPEGSHAITAADFKLLEAVRAAKIEKPDDLKRVIEEHGKLSAESAEHAADQLLVDALTAIDVTNIDAGKDLLAGKGLVIEFRKERIREGGKMQTVEVPYVRKASEKESEAVPLIDYIEDKHASFVDVLLAEPDDDAEDESERSDAGAGGTQRRRSLRRDDDAGDGASESEVPMQRVGGSGAQRRRQGSGRGGGVAVAAQSGSRARGSNAPSAAAIEKKIEDSHRAQISI